MIPRYTKMKEVSVVLGDVVWCGLYMWKKCSDGDSW